MTQKNVILPGNTQTAEKDPMDTKRFSQRQVDEIVQGSKEATEKVRATLTAVLWHVLKQLPDAKVVIDKQDIIHTDYIVDMQIQKNGNVAVRAVPHEKVNVH